MAIFREQKYDSYVGSIANTWTILNSSELDSITTFVCCFTLLNLDKPSLLLDGPEYQADRLQRGRTVSMSAVCHDLGFWSNDTDSWNF